MATSGTIAPAFSAHQCGTWCERAVSVLHSVRGRSSLMRAGARVLEMVPEVSVSQRREHQEQRMVGSNGCPCHERGQMSPTVSALRRPCKSNDNLIRPGFCRVENHRRPQPPHVCSAHPQAKDTRWYAVRRMHTLVLMQHFFLIESSARTRRCHAGQPFPGAPPSLKAIR